MGLNGLPLIWPFFIYVMKGRMSVEAKKKKKKKIHLNSITFQSRIVRLQLDSYHDLKKNKILQYIMLLIIADSEFY